MKVHHHRSGAAALLFVLCLLFTPVAEARVRDGEWSFPERIARIIRNVQKLFGGVSSQENFPMPPKP